MVKIIMIKRTEKRKPSQKPKRLVDEVYSTMYMCLVLPFFGLVGDTGGGSVVSINQVN